MTEFITNDYPKTYDNAMYPVNCHKSSNLFGRVEPLVTPDQLKSRYLKKIDMSEFTDEDLKDQINLAQNEFELMTGLDLVQTQYQQRLAFDRDLYRSFIYVKLEKRMIQSVEDMSVMSSNGENIYRVPPSWLEMGNAHKGQINLIPLLTVFAGQSVSSLQQVPSAGGLVFLTAVNNLQWLPAFWTIKYTSGLSKSDGQVPIIANDVVGMTAAIFLLGLKQAQNKYNSTSIGQDGISQSSGSAGTQVYQPQIDLLTMRRDKMIEKIKARFSSKYWLSNI